MSIHRKPGRCVLSLVVAAIVAVPAWSAEPSAIDAHQPGVTIGTPTGRAPPTGVLANLTPSYYNVDYLDSAGKANGTSVETTSLTPTLIWSTGLEVLGAQYYQIVNQPFVNVHIHNGLGHSNTVGLSNFYLSPINLSWTLAPGVFVSTGAGFYAPWGNGGAGNDYWTYEQSLAFSYLRDGWDLTASAYYDINTENGLTKYTSGDQLYVDFTATKTFDGIEVGPAGYLVEQTTSDQNTGFAYGPFKPTFGKVQRIALGGLVGTRVGPVEIKGYVTGEIYARNGASGVRGWLNLSVPLWLEGGHP